MMIRTPSPLRILIADDCPRVRSALRLLIENEGCNCKVVGEVEDVRGLQACANRKDADLVLLDWELPGLPDSQEQVADFITRLHASGRHLQVVAFSGYIESSSQARKAGVDAFISKIDPPEGIIAILKEVGRE